MKEVLKIWQRSTKDLAGFIRRSNDRWLTKITTHDAAIDIVWFGLASVSKDEEVKVNSGSKEKKSRHLFMTDKRCAHK